MIELIRNCAHGSEIATYLNTNDAGEKKILKATTNPSGIESLQNEVRGWNWYQKQRYPNNINPICRVTQERKKYLQIEIAFIDGKKAICKNGLKKNFDIISKVVNHYCNIWPQNQEYSALHGDLSLDNILINSDGVHIVDWEHFCAHGAPWGFDIIYLLFETLYFGMRSNTLPTNEDIKIIREQIKVLNSHHKLHPELTKSPLKYLREFLSTNADLWGEQLALFPMKLPIVAFTPDQITSIDKMIDYHEDHLL